MNKYHPEYDKPDAYLKAAKAETDPAKKLLLQRAAATIAYMGKHMNATTNLLCKINNDIVNALGDDGDYLDAEDMSDYLPDIRAAIEHCDDIKEKFHTPHSEWKHLCDDVEIPDLYYLQDSRQYVGNDHLWWAKGGRGYTTDLSKAELYTKEEAIRKNNCRSTDIPWPTTYIDRLARPAVDMQYTKIEEALKGTGIELKKEPKTKPEIYNCGVCGRFVSVEEYFTRCHHGNPCRKCEDLP